MLRGISLHLQMKTGYVCNYDVVHMQCIYALFINRIRECLISCHHWNELERFVSL